MERIKMGSLFDGSAGFPLAAIMYGMEAVWASEIEPYPIRVTSKRLPYMKHYGDISKINGASIEPVDVITGGSPCQDMSVAGKRAGLDGERSSLFREQIRIIKEMRDATNGRYPRYMVWENVPGALSSNKGADFRCVLEETARIKDAEFHVPEPDGKWSTAGIIMGKGFSIGWRILDAQYWGVPQRRRRIFLVADFDATSAGEILFKREGLSWHFTQSRKAWQSLTGNTAEGIGEAGKSCIGFCAEQSAKTRGIGAQEEKSPTLRAGVTPAIAEQYSVDFGRTADRIQMNASKAVTLLGEGGGGGAKTGLYCLPKNEPQYAVSVGSQSDIIQMNPSKSVTLCGGQGGKGARTGLYCLPKENIYCMATQQGNAEICKDLSPTITAAAGMSGNNQPIITVPKEAYGVVSKGDGTAFLMNEKHMSLSCGGGQAGQGTPTVCQPQKAYNICSYGSNAMKSDNPHSGIYEADTSRTLDLNGGNPACNQGGMMIVEPVYSFEPGIAKREGSDSRFVEDCTPTLRASMGDNQISVAYGKQIKSFHLTQDPISMDDVTPCISGSSSGGQATVGVCYSLQGNMIGREDHNGPQGNGINEDVSFTLNTIDRHAVVYAIDRESFNSGQHFERTPGIADNEIASTLNAQGPSAVGYRVCDLCFWDGTQTCGTLTARNSGGQQRMPDKENFNAVIEKKCYQEKTGCLLASGYSKLGTQEAMNDMFVANEYIVRRLTPLECSRLQGFPDWWTADLGTKEEDITEEMMVFWRDVFETHRKVVTKKNKPKTDKQIKKWLQEPESDSAEYKMWGNGVALPCVLYVMEGIADVLRKG